LGKNRALFREGRICTDSQFRRFSYDGNVLNFDAFDTTGSDPVTHSFVARSDGQALKKLDAAFQGASPISSMDAFGTSVVFETWPDGFQTPLVYLFQAPLSVHGNSWPGGNLTFRIAYPEDAGEGYQLGASYSSSPGFPLPDGRVVPLTPDSLTVALRRTESRLFENDRGFLGSAGVAEARLHLPASAMPGVRFFVAGVTATGVGVNAVHDITQPVSITLFPRPASATQ
jgi:hypothetical protein